MSTAIHTEQVHDPMAWVGSDFAGDEDLVYRLSPATGRGTGGGDAPGARRCRATTIELEHVHHPDVDGPAP